MGIKAPTKITIQGRVEVGKRFIGFAKSQMEILKNQMSFQGLKQSSREIQPEPGVVIKCWVSFALSEAVIVVSGGKKEEAPAKTKECFCLPSFSFGYVLAVHYDDPCSYYDVEICQGINNRFKYVEFNNVLSLDYAVSEEGQPVLVSLVPCTSGSLCGCSSVLNMCERHQSLLFPS